MQSNWDYAKIITHGKVYKAAKFAKIGDMIASATSWIAGDMERGNESKMRNAFCETCETKKPDGGGFRFTDTWVSDGRVRGERSISDN